MADVTLGYAPADGNVASALGISQNFYRPTTPAASYAELNGLIEKANMDTGAWKVRAGLIRDRTMGNGRMVGSTMNQDILGVLSPSANTESGAFKPIAGAAMELYIPKTPRMFWATWQIVTSNDIDLGSGANADFRFRVDGAQQAAQNRAQPAGSVPTGTHRPSHDHVWSGHWAAPTGSPIAIGWHTLSVAFWGSAATGTITSPGCMTRIRVRNMKYFYLS